MTISKYLFIITEKQVPRSLVCSIYDSVNILNSEYSMSDPDLYFNYFLPTYVTVTDFLLESQNSLGEEVYLGESSSRWFINSSGENKYTHGASTGVPTSLYLLERFYEKRDNVVQLTPGNIKAITMIFNTKMDSNIELHPGYRKNNRGLRKRLKIQLGKHVGCYSFLMS